MPSSPADARVPTGALVPARALPPHLQALLDPARPLAPDVLLVPDTDPATQLLVALPTLGLAALAASIFVHHIVTRLAPQLAAGPDPAHHVGFDTVASAVVLLVATLVAVALGVRALLRRADLAHRRWRHGVLATPEVLLVHRRDGTCRVFPRACVRALGSHVGAGDHGPTRRPTVVWRREDGSEASYLLDAVRAGSPEEARLRAWVGGA